MNLHTDTQAPRPEALPVLPEGIPTELKDINAWVMWRYKLEKDKKDKWTKIPYQLNGRGASSTDRATWGTFPEALKRYKQGGYDGIGFVFHDGIVGIDLDHCCDVATGKKGEPWASEIVQKTKSYCEYSPSGQGVHIYVRGKMPGGGRKKGNVEIYGVGRYFTVTGHVIGKAPRKIEADQGIIDSVHSKYFEVSKPEKPVSPPQDEHPPKLHDDVLLGKAFSAKNGDKIKRLYDGDFSEYPSQSEADSALCCHFSFWTQDPIQLDRLFHASKLFREKWDEKHYGDGETYGQKTISKALGGSREHYGDRNDTQREGVKQKEFWPELISAKNLLSMPPDPTRWIWTQCLPVGGCSILVSKPKVGKTTLAANLSIAVSRGLPFLGRDTQKSPVAYLSLDASLPEITENLTALGLRESDPIFIHAGSAPRDTVRWLMQRVKENGVRLVVIDTLQRLFKFKDVNDYALVTNTMEPLLEEARAQNVHLLITHHAKKDAYDDLDSAIGSTAIRGLAYTYLHLKRLPGSDRRIFRSDQRNGKNFPELALIFNKEGWLEVFGTRDDAEIEEVKPKILEALEAEGSDITEREIRRAVPAKGWIVGQGLRQLFKAGDLDRTGKGKKGDPFRFSLAPSTVCLREKKDSSLNSFLSRDGNMIETTGLETGNGGKSVETQGGMLVPKNQDENGTRKDEKRDAGLAGLESEEG